MSCEDGLERIHVRYLPQLPLFTRRPLEDNTNLTQKQPHFLFRCSRRSLLPPSLPPSAVRLSLHQHSGPTTTTRQPGAVPAATSSPAEEPSASCRSISYAVSPSALPSLPGEAVSTTIRHITVSVTTAPRRKHHHILIYLTCA